MCSLHYNGFISIAAETSHLWWSHGYWVEEVVIISHDGKESLLVTLATVLKQTKHLSENSYETYRLLICDG